MSGIDIIDRGNFDNHLLSPLSEAQFAEVIAALKAAPTSGRLDVRGTKGLRSPVAKYDTISFDNSATLLLEATDVPFIAIAARELILDIKNPDYRAYLSRPVGVVESDILKRLDGLAGASGSKGAQGGTHDRVGQPGGPGGTGCDGGDAVSMTLPPVFLFVQSFKFGDVGTPARQYLYLNFSGLRGGNGGTGGRGGDGGRGGNGQNGVSDVWGCREGGGPGGRGGNSGAGGQGGDAANGGNGSTIYMYAPNPEKFDFTTTSIEGGPAGRPGAGGDPGIPGGGGDGAVQVGWCGAKPNGRSGLAATRGQQGAPAADGQRGAQFVRARDNSDFF